MFSQEKEEPYTHFPPLSPHFDDESTVHVCEFEYERDRAIIPRQKGSMSCRRLPGPELRKTVAMIYEVPGSKGGLAG